MSIEACLVNFFFFNHVITLLFLRHFNLNIRVFLYKMLSSKTSFEWLSGQWMVFLYKNCLSFDEINTAGFTVNTWSLFKQFSTRMCWVWHGYSQINSFAWLAICHLTSYVRLWIMMLFARDATLLHFPSKRLFGYFCNVRIPCMNELTLAQ